MAIPRIIYQTFESQNKIWFVRMYIRRLMRKNPGWKREFYDDNRVSEFFKENFDTRIWKAYERLQIGAAKADFFRYAILYIKGGVYLDMDATINKSIDDYIKQDDKALISWEKKSGLTLFLQWALIYEKGHPFLKRTIEYIVENIEQNKYPHDVHKMTGPTVYTRAVQDVIKETPAVSYRTIPNEYDGIFEERRHPLVKLFMYHNKKNRWHKIQRTISVVRDMDNE